MSIQKFSASFKMKSYTWTDNPFVKNIPQIGVIIILSWTMTGLLTKSINLNSGHLVYALDDPYIHMAIGRNLLIHGVWGTSPDSFSASSSSLLWPILNAVGFLLFGHLDMIPLILNILSALLCIFLMFRISYFLGLPRFVGVLTILPVLYLAPIPALIMTGMEHITHFALSLAVIYYTVKILINEKDKRNHIILLVLLFLLAAVRYEGIFLGLVVAGCLLIKKDFKLGILSILVVVLPMLIFGAISVHNGWFFLPNPILLKSDIPLGGVSMPFLTRTISSGLRRLNQQPEYIWLIVFSTLFLFFSLLKRGKKYKELSWMHLLFLGMFIPHLLWAGFGWFYRYEMYLIGVGIFLDLSTLGLFLCNPKPTRWWKYLWRGFIVLLIILSGFHFFSYRLKANRIVVTATGNIYQQQYQMARFVDEYYTHQGVAVNDIGAISYYTDANVIDLWGLSNLEVSQMVIEKYYDTTAIQEITQSSDVQIAMVYDSWFTIEKEIPASWIRVGQWIIPNNVVCGDDTVSIYAVAPDTENQIMENLREFSQNLPGEVVQRGKYMMK